jgi:hypothetical protein
MNVDSEITDLFIGAWPIGDLLTMSLLTHRHDGSVFTDQRTAKFPG